MARPAWTLHPDRALPSDPVVRPIACEIAEQTLRLGRSWPMHGHVDAGLLARDEPFLDPAALLVVPDHYLVRMLVSQGVPHDALGVLADGQPVETDPRAIWRTFAAHWHLFRGTPTRYWMEHVLVDVFGVSERLSAESADRVRPPRRAARRPCLPPARVVRGFGIEILATTDPATYPSPDHATLDADGWGERVVPTFRPDALLHVDRPGWRDDVALLGDVTGTTVDGYRALVRPEERRRAFVAAGCAGDRPRGTWRGRRAVERLRRRADRRRRACGVDARDAAAFSGHMLFEMARACRRRTGWSCEMHLGVLRDHDPAVFAAGRTSATTSWS